MKLDDDLLSRAAILVRDKKMNALLEYEDYPEYVFSGEFERKMQDVIDKLARGEIKHECISIGWQYYVRHGLVAVLVCFLLTCIAAPQTVMAGYHKLIEVIEHVVTEYTEYRYKVNDDVNDEFRQVKFGYLPDGLEKTDEIIEDRMYYIEYRNEKNFFRLEQNIITEEDRFTYIVDTENAIVAEHWIGESVAKIVSKKGMNGYMWTYDNYLITGQSNYTMEEIVKILEKIII